MRKIILIIGFILLIIIPKPKYYECDNIKIIESLSIDCSDRISASFHEINSKREDNSVQFHYNDIFYTTNNLYDLKMEIDNNHLYVKGVKEITTNCNNINEISHLLGVSKSKIKRK